MKELKIEIPDSIHWDDLINMIQDNSVYIDPVRLMEIINEQGWDRV